MFIGHFAVGFASKKFAPWTSLGVLITAPLFLDVLWPFFVLMGWEKVKIDPGNTRFTPMDFVSYPWSHSLLMSVVWATAFAGIYYVLSRYATGAVVLWIGVVSHWVLDWVTHRPDMPLYPNGPRYGLGLWNSIVGTMAVEIGMLALGLWLYARTTRAQDKIGRYAFLGYVVLLLLLYAGDRFSTPPDNTAEIAWAGIFAAILLIPWAWWFDRHRSPSTKQEH